MFTWFVRAVEQRNSQRSHFGVVSVLCLFLPLTQAVSFVKNHANVAIPSHIRVDIKAMPINKNHAIPSFTRCWEHDLTQDQWNEWVGTYSIKACPTN